MKLFSIVASNGEKILDRVLCVVGAVVFSQAPEFMQQYLQRLGGHLDEARRILGQFQQSAALSGTSFQDYVSHLTGNDDRLIVSLGKNINAVVQRVTDLGGAEEALRTASVLKRPFAFLAHFDPEIALATFRAYRPAVPTTVEGLVYGGIGVMAALSLYYGCVKYPAAAFLRHRRAKKEQLAQAAPDSPPSP